MPVVLPWGFVLGFVGSMPVAGAVSVLVCQRGLSGRSLHGLALGAGAALVEGLWCFAVIAGASRLVERWPGALTVARIAGGVLLIALGIYLMRRHGTTAAGSIPTAPPRGLAGEFRFGALLVAANPAVPLNWLSMLTVAVSLGLAPSFPAAPMAVGAVLGILAWYSCLLLMLRKFHRRLEIGAVGRIMCVLGAVLVGAGTFALLQSFGCVAGIVSRHATG